MNLFRPTHLVPHSVLDVSIRNRYAKYAVAIGIACAAVAATKLALPFVSLNVPFIVSLGGTIVTAWLVGFTPALSGIGATVFLWDYYFATPVGSFEIGLADFGALTLFAFESSLMAYFTDQIKQSRQRAIAERDRLEQNVRTQQEALVSKEGHIQQLLAELSFTEERERRDLALELHDYLAQLLAMAKMHLAQAKSYPDSHAKRVDYLEKTEDLLRCSIRYTRSLMAELSPPQLHGAGVLESLNWLAQQMVSHGLTVDVEMHSDQIELSHDRSAFLYRAVRELLLNVIKHASAQHATVTLSRVDGNLLRITVRDQGCGIDPTTAPRSIPGKSFGLVSIRERLSEFGGTLEITSRPGLGTTVCLLLPLGDTMPALAASAAHADTD